MNSGVFVTSNYEKTTVGTAKPVDKSKQSIHLVALPVKGYSFSLPLAISLVAMWRLFVISKLYLYHKNVVLCAHSSKFIFLLASVQVAAIQVHCSHGHDIP